MLLAFANEIKMVRLDAYLNSNKTVEIKPGMILDYDANGNVLGVELLYVNKRAELPMKKAA